MKPQELSAAKRALLSQYLQGKVPRGALEVPAITRRTPGARVPLSFEQMYVWQFAQAMPTTPVHVKCVTIHLPGPLDEAALTQSVEAFFHRHAIWRTSFPVVDAAPIQHIAPPTRVTLPVMDLRHLPASTRDVEMLRYVTAWSRQPFDLVHGPLVRLLLVRLNTNEHRLFLTLHYIVFDGVAIYHVFLPELYALYDAYTNGLPSPLLPLSLEYADYACWQHTWSRDNQFERQVAYWRTQLADAPAVMALPTDRPRQEIMSYHGAIHPFTIPKRLTDAVRQLSHEQGVTLFMTLLSAFYTLLFSYSGQEDILVGTRTAGRKRTEVKAMMGHFVNPVALYVRLAGNPTFRELLERVRNMTVEAVAHDEVPFEYLIHALQPERNLITHPFLHVMLTLEPPLPINRRNWTLTQSDIDIEATAYDLYLELDDRLDCLLGYFEYRTDLFHATSIASLARRWSALLEVIATNPELRIATIATQVGAI